MILSYFHIIPGSRHLLLGIVVSLTLISCGEPVEELTVEEQFALGETLCLEARWGEARDVLREFLLEHPDHPGAHFYLGRSYLFWEEDFRPIIAEGELQMAYQLFLENGEVSYIERFPTEYFKLICNIESIKSCLKEFTIRQALGEPVERLRAPVNRARRYLEIAQSINPERPEVMDSVELVEAMEELTGIAPTP